MEQNMKHRTLTFATAAAFLTVTGAAMADHNSKNGEGWANMPNDIHNTRIETREADDNEAFKDFVKYGAGSRTENRFDTDSNTPQQAGPAQDMVKTQDMAKTQEQKRIHQDSANTQDMVKTQTRQRIDQNTATETKSRSETRSRQRLDAPSTSRASRSANNTRSSSRRGGRRN
jgi:hypothetical protein